jgi:hypothetical protein
MSPWHKLAYVIPVFVFAFDKATTRESLHYIFTYTKYVMLRARVNTVENLSMRAVQAAVIDSL